MRFRARLPRKPGGGAVPWRLCCRSACASCPRNVVFFTVRPQTEPPGPPADFTGFPVRYSEGIKNVE